MVINGINYYLVNEKINFVCLLDSDLLVYVRIVIRNKLKLFKIVNNDLLNYLLLFLEYFFIILVIILVIYFFVNIYLGKVVCIVRFLI